MYLNRKKKEIEEIEGIKKGKGKNKIEIPADHRNKKRAFLSDFVEVDVVAFDVDSGGGRRLFLLF
jgi:hypothetical protein